MKQTGSRTGDDSNSRSSNDKKKLHDRTSSGSFLLKEDEDS